MVYIQRIAPPIPIDGGGAMTAINFVAGSITISSSSNQYDNLHICLITFDTMLFALNFKRQI